MMGRIFGPDKVVLSDVFSGVTAGLAIRARGTRPLVERCCRFIR